jgi:hypothetical protein
MYECERLWKWTKEALTVEAPLCEAARAVAKFVIAPSREQALLIAVGTRVYHSIREKQTLRGKTEAVVRAKTFSAARAALIFL